MSWLFTKQCLACFKDVDDTECDCNKDSTYTVWDYYGDNGIIKGSVIVFDSVDASGNPYIRAYGNMIDGNRTGCLASLDVARSWVENNGSYAAFPRLDNNQLYTKH